MSSKSQKLARASVIEKASIADFSAMTKAEYGDWIDALTIEEFMALLNIHDEFANRKEMSQPIPQAEPDDWIVYTGGGECPVPPETIVKVLFPDGDEGGPNPAHMFMWDATRHSAQTLAYRIVGPDEGGSDDDQ